MSENRENLCIIVNPEPLAGDVRTRLIGNQRVIVFEDLESMERWRSRCTSSSNLACEVEAALREVGCDYRVLPRDIAGALDRLVRQPITPTVADFAKNGLSVRTFYRRWNEILPIRPKEFLDRVRFLHAIRLMEHGCSAKEAAALAGYGSTDHLRAHTNKSQRIS